MRLPDNHPKRLDLNNEVHARPPESLVAPVAISFLALYTGGKQNDLEWQHLCSLCERLNVKPPPPKANHFVADVGAFRLKWERHSEFQRYKFIVADPSGDPFSTIAISRLPPEWVAEIPGHTMVATHVALTVAPENEPDPEQIDRAMFSGSGLVGSAVAGGAAFALTDFRIYPDGFSRLLVQDRNMTPRQAGRTVQRLLEIDTYRMMALLALPMAQSLAPNVAKFESDLVKITTELVNATQADEAGLLERLTKLEAESVSSDSQSHYRFSAAAAYYDLVQRRIADLREQRIAGLQTFKEFTERRLAPAMNTCLSVAARQDSLSERMAHASQLLSARVDITREQQNQALLESMNRRGKLQLRLQQTVEGLSIAAVTYYVVGLIGYAAKAMKSLGMRVDPEVAAGVSIPLVAVAVAISMHRIRKMINRAG